jgi:hypothetical protein
MNDATLNEVQVTSGDLIKEFLIFRAHLEKEGERFKTYTKPYSERMEWIRNELLRRMHADKVDNYKGEDGTAFKTTAMAPSIADSEKYIDWAMENWDQGASEMFALRAPAVEGLRDYMDKHGGALPPGIAVEYNISCSVRKK